MVRAIRREPGSPDDLQRSAIAHAELIAAACYSPHLHVSADSYQRLMAAKTQEVCVAILRSSIPPETVVQLQQMVTGNTWEAPPPRAPAAILEFPEAGRIDFPPIQRAQFDEAPTVVPGFASLAPECREV
jgi:hypothetical protein